MAAPVERSQIELRGLKRRGKILGAVLVLAGAKPSGLLQASMLAAMLVDQCLLVAVDGGLKTCSAGRRRPDLFVGGGAALRHVPADVPTVLMPKDKEISDFSSALSELRSRRVQVVSTAGLLGGRLDHEWANLLELGRWSRWFAGLLAPTSRGTVVVTRRGCQAVTVREGVVSVLTLSPTSTVTLLGTRRPLTRQRLRAGSHALGNVTGTEIDLTVHSGVVALVLLPPTRSKAARRAALARA